MSHCGLHCLKINNITVRAGGQTLVEDVSLHAHCGEITALKAGTATVKVLKTEDKWFGVTYKEDKQYVIDSFKQLYADGVYKEKLFS